MESWGRCTFISSPSKSALYTLQQKKKRLKKKEVYIFQIFPKISKNPPLFIFFVPPEHTWEEGPDVA